MMKKIWRAAALFTVILAFAASAEAAPKAELWDKWLAHNPESTEVIDHSSWQDFLTAYVAPDGDGVVRVNYSGVSPADRKRLKAYLSNLAAITVTGLRRAEQLAFWVNLYNALTVDVVLDNYPVETIRDIDDSPGFFSDGPWGRKRLTIEGEAVSLDDIEHRIARPIWRDARLHYLFNCASVGCPNLPLQAFSTKTAETTMEDAAKTFINSKKGLRFVDRDLVVSSLYDWYGDDFGDDIFLHFRRYASPALQKQLKGINRVADYTYDWALNDSRK